MNKGLGFAILLFLGSVYGQDIYQGTSTGQDLDNVIHAIKKSNSVLYVNGGYSTNLDRKEFQTIGEAINNYTDGGTIMIFPGIYAEDIFISDSGMVIIGVERNSCIINGGLNLTAKECKIENLTIEDDLRIVCRDTSDNYVYGNKIKNLCIYGNIYLGVSDTSNNYKCDFIDCDILGIDKDIYFNCNTKTTYGSHRFYNCSIQSPENRSYVDSLFHRILIKQGDIRFYYCKALRFTLFYENPSSWAHLRFDNCGRVVIDTIVTQTTNLTPNWGIFVGVNSELLFYFDTFSINGLFEIDIIHCRWYMPHIVFNSTALSRFSFVEQIGWNHDMSITGTGLENLRITHSVFGCVKPVGLQADTLNYWEALIDN